MLTGVNYQTGTDPSFSYNIDGLRTSVTDGAGTQNWTYDALHRVLTHQQPIGGSSTKTVTNTYDSTGNRTQMTLSGVSGAWTFGYDGTKIDTVTNPWGQTWNWWDYANGWTKWQENPVYATETDETRIAAQFTYLKRGAVNDIDHWKYVSTLLEGAPLAQSGSDGVVPPEFVLLVLDPSALWGEASNWFHLTYTRNKSMDITQVVEDDYTSGSQLTGTTTFAYDNFHQLTSDGRSGNLSYSTRTLTYDSAGNRASYNSTNWTNNAANQLTAAPTWSETYTFDRKGNTATKVVGGTTTTYGYDFEQPVATVTKTVSYTHIDKPSSR